MLIQYLKNKERERLSLSDKLLLEHLDEEVRAEIMIEVNS